MNFKLLSCRYMEDTVADWFPQAVEEKEALSETEVIAEEPALQLPKPSTRRRKKRLSC